MLLIIVFVFFRWCLLSVLLSLFLLACEAAPAFTFKKSFSRYPSNRVERRLVGASAPSPVHFITPFVGLPSLFGGGGGSPSASSVYKLPLRLFSNGKPHAVFHGIPKMQMEYLYPRPMSNLIRLPLKYVSNAKPVGVYFNDFNYL